MFFLKNNENLYTPIISYAFAIITTSILSFIIWIYKGQFKNGNFNQKGPILKGKHTIKELN